LLVFCLSPFNFFSFYWMWLTLQSLLAAFPCWLLSPPSVPPPPHDCRHCCSSRLEITHCHYRFSCCHQTADQNSLPRNSFRTKLLWLFRFFLVVLTTFRIYSVIFPWQIFWRYIRGPK
jgi:hypothetical protein